MRNLVVCLDGTWNSPDQKDGGRQVPSNVVKMARAVKTATVAPEPEQKVYYHTGVGTGGRLDKIIGGMTGQGILMNIMDAYCWLIENYEEGSNLYLFGFSRGAYTARSLSGLIGICGLPAKPKDKEHMLLLREEAKNVYRTKNVETRSLLAEKFKKKYDAFPGKVHFIGVWDTVGALGVPTWGPLGWWTRRRSGFHDVTLGEHIKHACHAVAINERRGPFKHTLWNPENLNSDQTLLQVWFPGVHSNVGGGYVDCGLSDRAFLWMLSQAYKYGMATDDTYVNLRSQPDCYGELRDTLSLTYKLMFWNRPRAREIGVTHADSEMLHMSAINRWNHPSKPDTAPKNFTDVDPDDTSTRTIRSVPKAATNTWEEEFNLRRELKGLT